jgi:hypothetical protein
MKYKTLNISISQFDPMSRPGFAGNIAVLVPLYQYIPIVYFNIAAAARAASPFGPEVGDRVGLHSSSLTAPPPPPQRPTPTWRRRRRGGGHGQAPLPSPPPPRRGLFAVTAANHCQLTIWPSVSIQNFSPKNPDFSPNYKKQPNPKPKTPNHKL